MLFKAQQPFSCQIQFEGEKFKYDGTYVGFLKWLRNYEWGEEVRTNLVEFPQCSGGHLEMENGCRVYFETEIKVDKGMKF